MSWKSRGYVLGLLAVGLSAGCMGDSPLGDPGPEPELIVRADEDATGPLEPGDELAYYLGPVPPYLWTPEITVRHLDCSESRDCRFTARIYVLDSGEILSDVSDAALSFERVGESELEAKLVLLLNREPPLSWADLPELDGMTVTFDLIVEEASGRSTDAYSLPLTLKDVTRW